ncbi:uncharacterized protein Z518_10846 [Rhinocladiella mackenziei CBS 650.93]|uniref:Protein phosphatase n=1 Tax=Rhinocladiella mackenziei CBS 650.93 TaxID=1442369 RepID=A0A0D2I2E1_9EURO|nr:uncharacterized protein Z518_10846 [Rhinocladiella mackenziei CBS 650.93]KIW99918.1 hypothetical protein Z518_10846 [Rhinocladiella mackenziei CBS 650.93]
MLAQVARCSRYAVAHKDLDHRIIRASGVCFCRPPPLCVSVPLTQRSPPPQRRHFPFGTFTTSTLHHRRYLISEGRTTAPSDDESSEYLSPSPSSPFYLETGYSIFAKRPSRPFPPPFVSLPSGSFSDPLTTHNPVRGRRPSINGQPILGITNGDDAIIIGDQNFVAVNDGVGAWAQKERGHAALWSRLIAHFWALEVEKSFRGGKEVELADLNPIRNLQDAYDQTKAATKGSFKSDSEAQENAEPTAQDCSSSDADDKKPDANDILGTTTASSALLHYKRTPSSSPTPVVLATTLGDCKVLLVRPLSNEVLYRSKEQWHWFDCPRQLGTNSPDTPVSNAVTDIVEIEVGDVVAVLSDGVTDNLWEHEICENISHSVDKWLQGEEEARDGVVYVARTLMNAAREIAQDPNAESPYMERAFDEGIAAEGGKLDDISVVIGICRKRES